MTFEEILAQRKPNFEINGGYDQNPMPEVYGYYKEYVSTGQYPYLKSVVNFILTRENVKAELHRYLETEVYLASHQYQRERDKANAEKMVAEGYAPLTKSIFLEAINKHQRLEVVAEMDNVLGMTCKVQHIYKPLIDDNGEYFLLKPKHRRRGYRLSAFSKAFCKLVAAK